MPPDVPAIAVMIRRRSAAAIGPRRGELRREVTNDRSRATAVRCRDDSMAECREPRHHAGRAHNASRRPLARPPRCPARRSASRHAGSGARSNTRRDGRGFMGYNIRKGFTNVARSLLISSDSDVHAVVPRPRERHLIDPRGPSIRGTFGAPPSGRLPHSRRSHRSLRSSDCRRCLSTAPGGRAREITPLGEIMMSRQRSTAPDRRDRSTMHRFRPAMSRRDIGTSRHLGRGPCRQSYRAPPHTRARGATFEYIGDELARSSRTATQRKVHGGHCKTS